MSMVVIFHRFCTIIGRPTYPSLVGTSLYHITSQEFRQQDGHISNIKCHLGLIKPNIATVTII